MLSFDDDATIRNAILKRLDGERGVRVCDIKMAPARNAVPPYIRVGIESLLDAQFTCVSFFDLPGEFEIGHLRNEIDEVAEQYKSARLDRFFNGPTENGRMRTMRGTGLRGRWGA